MPPHEGWVSEKTHLKPEGVDSGPFVACVRGH